MYIKDTVCPPCRENGNVVYYVRVPAWSFSIGLGTFDVGELSADLG